MIIMNCKCEGGVDKEHEWQKLSLPPPPMPMSILLASHILLLVSPIHPKCIDVVTGTW